jgi:hypothetical protein
MDSKIQKENTLQGIAPTSWFDAKKFSYAKRLHPTFRTHQKQFVI